MRGKSCVVLWRGSLTLALAAVAVVTSSSGCGEYSLDFGDKGAAAQLRKPELWTLLDTRRAQLEGRPVAPTTSFPDGLPDLFLKPNPDGSATATLKINAAFSEGDAAAFIVPEIWLNFDVIWLQPWYVLISAWNDKSPNANRLKDPATNMNVPPVWDVGPRSLFYSPFWAVFYAVVPPGTPSDRYTSAQRVFDDKLPIYPGPAIIYSVRPDDVVLDMKPVHPNLPDKDMGGVSMAPASFVDGEKIAYFGEGANSFRFNRDNLEIEEVPLYFLARHDVNGAVVPMGTPPIMGSGPVFGRRPVDLAAGRPRFGSYSRFYFAVITAATADAFDPALYPDAAALIVAKGGDPRAYLGRVATNAKKVADTDKACFAAPDFPTACSWLDSQARVEDAAGTANIIRTEVSACSPLVFYAGKGIGR